METIKNRHELVFIYDSKFANPNWDPTENNELRMIWDKLFVTDVRLKRTIRDYIDSLWISWSQIFVKECIDEHWNVIDVKWRLKSIIWTIKDEKEITSEHINQLKGTFIDIRLFWSAIKMKLTWPVQFNFGGSIHEIESINIKGTTVFSSWENKWQWAFTGMFISPYTIISFHGIVNEQSAKFTNMTEDDFKLLKEAMWNWTKNLLTRSKFEQLPRLLVDVKFKEWVKTHIWELDRYIKYNRNESISEDKFITDISDWSFDFTNFNERIHNFSDKIDMVYLTIDHRVLCKGISKQSWSQQINWIIYETEII